MPLYLHEPIEDAASLSKLLRDGARESEHLEFKGAFWVDTDKSPAREEAAKDVAAFLNALGGTILVGVGEEGDGRAGKLSGSHANEGERAKLLDWLKSDLAPEAASKAVHVSEISVKATDGISHEVLAVNIEPWPNGPVAVRAGPDKESYRFPVRRGRETRFMPWEEIVATNDAAHRALFLRLKALVTAADARRVVITTPTWVRILGKAGPFFVEPKVGHGWLRDTIKDDHVVLHLDCYHVADDVGRRLQFQRIPDGERPSIELFGQKIDVLTGLSQLAASEEQKRSRQARPLAVPFEFIEAAWTDASIKSTVGCDLSPGQAALISLLRSRSASKALRSSGVRSGCFQNSDQRPDSCSKRRLKMAWLVVSSHLAPGSLSRS